MQARTVLIFIAIMFISISVLMNSPAFAEETLKQVISDKYEKEKDICKVVKQTIKEGMNTKEITKTCIMMGHDACLVVRCAIDADASLEQIINGALEAGTTPDVCSKCAIDAGADPVAVAKILETGLGYPPVAIGLSPIEIGLPGGNKGGGSLSPSSPAAP
jgi:hypothetical protein